MKLKVTIGTTVFDAIFEIEKAPKTVAILEKLLPYDSQVVHVRWSGEGVWIPLGDTVFDLGFENHTSHPAPGHMIFYPGGYSETEILLAYGGVDFSSKLGQLAGNHFLTLTSNLDKLPEIGNHVLWHGATPIRIEKA
jgi:hypothetical protein